MSADMNMDSQTIPNGFQFSQGSLQDFSDCRRRFQLRYMQEVAWPAVQSEPAMENERSLQQGARFHHLVYQHLLGVPTERLTATIHSDDLRRWWENYLEYSGNLLAEKYRLYPEKTLNGPLGNYRLLAKYDLVAVTRSGKCTIFDWKTSRRRPRRTWLAERLQTRVYPYLLVQAGGGLMSHPNLAPEQVEMVYWFSEFPDQPERFVYDQAHYHADKEYLQGLIIELEGRAQKGNFPLTQDERQCAYCVYRSLCERGVQAGSLEALEASVQLEGDIEIDLDFEQVAEIEF
jgi:CRISPR/Cas system-associated exonuclease Cas4 (RecB family)